MKISRSRWIALSAVLAGAGGVAWLLVAYLHVPALREVVAGRLYRSGQPGSLDWDRLDRHYHIRTVVNLRPWGEDGGEWADPERTAAAEHGMKLIHLPMRNHEAPSLEQGEQFLAIARDPANWPVLVHCKRGKDRTGTLVALFRMREQGWSPQRALDELRRIDGGDPVDGEVREFLDRCGSSATSGRTRRSSP